jgi:DNA-binding HxlR family transcriptional regulator
VEYSLTQKGHALLPLVEDMRAYGREWLGAKCATEPAGATVSAAA